MEHKYLVDSLLKCTMACRRCADLCLGEDNLEMMVKCIRTDLVCAEICSTTATILAGSYDNVRGMVEYCKSVCQDCGDECGKHDHEHCQECASACRECADACQKFLN